MWRLCRTAHDKVADFRKGRVRQPDDLFVAECELPGDPDSSRIAVGVRRAVAGIGLIDPLFIMASDRFPEDLGVLPLWDSMDWLSLVFELEKELDQKIPDFIVDWKSQNGFTIKQLVQTVFEKLTAEKLG